MLRAHGISEPGRIRTTNEDCFAIDEERQLLVVADGLGGHNAGEVASRLAVDSVVDFVREACASSPSPGPGWPFGFDPSLSEAGNRVRTAIHVANVRILETAMATDAYAGMGTTVVAALVHNGRLTVGHVGDSRLYLLADRALRPLTRDDSFAAAQNVLTNVVGGRAKTDVHVSEAALSGGELLVLLTDGVHGTLNDRWLLRLLTSVDDVKAMATGLVEAALTRGSQDNCTAVVGRYQA